jgi:hypothetical protein
MDVAATPKALLTAMVLPQVERLMEPVITAILASSKSRDATTFENARTIAAATLARATVCFSKAGFSTDTGLGAVFNKRTSTVMTLVADRLDPFDSAIFATALSQLLELLRPTVADPDHLNMVAAHKERMKKQRKLLKHTIPAPSYYSAASLAVPTAAADTASVLATLSGFLRPTQAFLDSASAVSNLSPPPRLSNPKQQPKPSPHTQTTGTRVMPGGNLHASDNGSIAAYAMSHDKTLMTAPGCYMCNLLGKGNQPHSARQCTNKNDAAQAYARTHPTYHEDNVVAAQAAFAAARLARRTTA